MCYLLVFFYGACYAFKLFFFQQYEIYMVYIWYPVRSKNLSAVYIDLFIRFLKYLLCVLFLLFDYCILDFFFRKKQFYGFIWNHLLMISLFFLMVNAFVKISNMRNKSINLKRINLHTTASYTRQKMKFSIKDLFSKCNQIRKKLRIWSHWRNA